MAAGQARHAMALSELALLRRTVSSAVCKEIVRQVSYDFERSRQSYSLLAQHDFGTATEDFDFLAFDPETFGKA